MFTTSNRTLKVGVALALAALILFAPLSAALAAPAPVVAPQPNQSCQVSLVTPGGSASAPGSAFNPGGVAGSVYAGTQPQNSNNPNSVSQYDVACYQNTIH